MKCAYILKHFLVVCIILPTLQVLAEVNSGVWKVCIVVCSWMECSRYSFRP